MYDPDPDSGEWLSKCDEEEELCPDASSQPQNLTLSSQQSPYRGTCCHNNRTVHH